MLIKNRINNFKIGKFIMKTFITKPKIVKKKWYIIDAKKEVLGRLVSKIIKVIQGKNKIEYTSNIDIGDYVIIINAEKVIVTGNKRKNKIYYHHTGYVGGIKKFSFEEMINKNPIKIFKNAIKGMLPKGPLGRVMYKKCKIYKGNIHLHIAQNPIPLKI